MPASVRVSRQARELAPLGLLALILLGLHVFYGPGKKLPARPGRGVEFPFKHALAPDPGSRARADKNDVQHDPAEDKAERRRQAAILELPEPPSKQDNAHKDTVNKMMYWLHGTPGFPIHGLHARPQVDRSWLPKIREDRYFLVNMDPGGFNNIRLAFEVNVAMALLLGRTMVLPAKKMWYLLGAVRLGVDDFFDMDDLGKLVPWITLEEYERRKGTGSAGKVPILKIEPLRNAFAYPNEDAVRRSYDPKILKYGLSDRTLIDATYVGDVEAIRVSPTHQYRLLGCYHTTFFFANKQHDRDFKRLMRDHIHYKLELWQLAAEAVDQLGGQGTYTSMHVRRGDLQYAEVKIDASKLLDNVRPWLKVSGKKKIYIATDEKDKSFFDPFRREGYEIVHWRDLHISKNNRVPFHLEGMLEQLVAAESNLFIGTRLSTFSSYVPRIRGFTVGLQNKELLYGDRKYSGDITRDGNEKRLDISNTPFYQGELVTFREPETVWLMEDN